MQYRRIHRNSLSYSHTGPSSRPPNPLALRWNSSMSKNVKNNRLANSRSAGGWLLQTRWVTATPNAWHSIVRTLHDTLSRIVLPHTFCHYMQCPMQDAPNSIHSGTLWSLRLSMWCGIFRYSKAPCILFLCQLYQRREANKKKKPTQFCYNAESIIAQYILEFLDILFGHRMFRIGLTWLVMTNIENGHDVFRYRPWFHASRENEKVILHVLLFIR